MGWTDPIVIVGGAAVVASLILGVIQVVLWLLDRRAKSNAGKDRLLAMLRDCRPELSKVYGKGLQQHKWKEIERASLAALLRAEESALLPKRLREMLSRIDGYLHALKIDDTSFVPAINERYPDVDFGVVLRLMCGYAWMAVGNKAHSEGKLPGFTAYPIEKAKPAWHAIDKEYRYRFPYPAP